MSWPEACCFLGNVAIGRYGSLGYHKISPYNDNSLKISLNKDKFERVALYAAVVGVAWAIAGGNK
jgi:hypothetical protein